jgi:hypothetical protein
VDRSDGANSHWEASAERVGIVTAMLVGTPPAPLPPTQPVNRSRRAAGAVAVALVMVLVVGAVAWASSGRNRRYPARWDPRVAAIASFVERTRGLRYDHPVRVYFLSPSQYRRAILGPHHTPTASDRTDARRHLGEMRALGVVEGDPDLLTDDDSLSDAGTLAFYDYQSKVVNVRGHTMTPELRVTLAHELTHALQDQHFDVSRAFTGSDSEATDAARSVIEGDAVDVENQYVDQALSPSERADYEREQQNSLDQSNSQLGDVPDYLTTLFGAPYSLGPSFVSLFGSNDRGQPDNPAIDGLLRTPPPAMSRLFDPIDQLHAQALEKVAAPDVPHASFDSGSIGALTLFAMLADRLDAVTAMDATDGWAGDSYVAYEQGTGSDRRVCVAATVRAKNDGALRSLRDALRGWQRAMPTAADATVSVHGDDVSLRSCDPGPASSGIGHRFSTAIGYPVGRLEIADAARSQGGISEQQAICVGDTAVRRFTPDELNTSDLTPELQQKLSEAVAAAAAAC